MKEFSSIMMKTIIHIATNGSLSKECKFCKIYFYLYIKEQMKNLLAKSEFIGSICMTKVYTQEQAIAHALGQCDTAFTKQHKEGNKYHVIENKYAECFDIYRIF